MAVASQVGSSPWGISGRVAILASGLDSAVMVAEAAAGGATVFPLYVRCGLRWEDEELAGLRRFLDAVACENLNPLAMLELPVEDVYGRHWGLGHGDVPDAQSRDEEVFLPGRNVLLLAKAMLWCAQRDVPNLALATLGANPFPDATNEFIQSFEAIVNRALGRLVVADAPDAAAGIGVAIRRPYAGLGKDAVIHRGRDLPMELTFSCLQPHDGLHCGRCNKCTERRNAFAAAGVPDRTRYESA